MTYSSARVLLLAIFYGTLLLAGCGKGSPEAKGTPGGGPIHPS